MKNMENKMKKNNILLLAMLTVSMLSCYVIPDNPFSARLQCYKKNYCDTAVNDCVVGSALFSALFTPSKSSSTTTTTTSSTTPVESLTNFSKSGTFSNSTFNSPQSYSSTSSSSSTLITPYNSATYSTSTPTYQNMNVTGTLNNPNIVDIMSISYTSTGYTAGSGSYTCIGYTNNTRIIEVSKISGNANCQLYSQFGASSNSTNSPTSETLLGTLSTSVNTITLNLSTGPTYLYVRCSGALNDQYAIKFAYSSLNKANEVFPCTNTSSSSSSSSSSSFTSNFLNYLTSPLTCIDADKTCKSDCDKKHFY